MVSKLRLAAYETHLRALESGADKALVKRLAAAYYDICAGIGDCKTPDVYGAFPMDPYSHTPAQGGARQPGLTGQVKEDIMCRFGELGVNVHNGRICFEPRLLRRDEFLPSPSLFTYYDISGHARTLKLKAGTLAFTYCQVPVIYEPLPNPSLTLLLANGTRRQQDGSALDREDSRAIFERSGAIRSIAVGVRLNVK